MVVLLKGLRWPSPNPRARCPNPILHPKARGGTYVGQRNLGKMNHRGTLSQGASVNKTKFPAAGASKTETQGYILAVYATPRLGV